MEQKKKYRLRVENCIGTIIDVYRVIRDELGSDVLLSHFKSLQQAVEGLDMGLVCEGDVLMVERATNVLLGEFRGIFEKGSFGPVYEERHS